jgi:DNA-binding ferritin-like protein
MPEKAHDGYAELAETVQEAIECAVACGDHATARELTAILTDIMATRNALDTPSSKPAKRKHH